ncbi:hypothetical protein [Laspinema palackyanum]
MDQNSWLSVLLNSTIKKGIAIAAKGTVADCCFPVGDRDPTPL